VLVIDMQRDFLEPGAPVATPGGLELVPRINRLTARARERGIPVIFTQEMHRADKSDFGIELEFEPPHCLEGTAGICVTSTVQHARNLDFRCFVLRDCVAGTTAERHEAALLCLGHVFGCVVSLAEIEPSLD
jgi:nicotinamidase-related amidase